MTRLGYVLAAASRAGCLAVVVLHGDQIIEVRRRRFDDYLDAPARVRRLILEVARDYQPTLLVVEPRLRREVPVARRIAPHVCTIELDHAKRALLLARVGKDAESAL